jgi:integrase
VKLTAKKVAKLVRRGAPGKYPDGHGLYLQVQNRNNASWFFRYQRDGKEHFPGLGPIHTVGLKEARERARALRLQLLDGINPIEARKAAKVQRALDAAKTMSFADAMAGYLRQHSAKWTNPRHAAQWTFSLNEYVVPILGGLPVREIDVPLILKVLEQRVDARRGRPAGSLWMTRPETGTRLRGRIESILDWAKARGSRAGDNPASWNLVRQALPARLELAKIEHFPALPHAQIPEFMAQLRTRAGSVARALEFTILCAVRSGETIGATWSELDLAEKVWTVPAQRMKRGREHRVPLSDRTVEILESLPRDNSEFVFNGPRRAGLSPGAMKMLLQRSLGKAGITVHGFRSAFRDWAGETTAFPHDVCEAALSHIRGKTERAYQRGDLFNKRRRLMNEWAEYCASPPQRTGADIVPIGAATGASRGKA